MGTFNSAIYPTTTGQRLGSDLQRWDAYINNLALNENLENYAYYAAL